jgi:hypothetical protein
MSWIADADESSSPEAGALASGVHGDLDPVDTAVVRLAEKVAGGAADLTEQDLGEVRALGLSDDEVLAMDPQLQEALTVGRPIDGA